MSTATTEYTLHPCECGRKFVSPQALGLHFAWVRKTGTHAVASEVAECPICHGEVGATVLAKHVELHNVIHECTTCHATFATRTGLMAHERGKCGQLVHHVEQPPASAADAAEPSFYCELCQRPFRGSGGFSTHMVKRHGIRPPAPQRPDAHGLTCAECGHVGKSYNGLAVHQARKGHKGLANTGSGDSADHARHAPPPAHVNGGALVPVNGKRRASFRTKPLDSRRLVEVVALQVFPSGDVPLAHVWDLYEYAQATDRFMDAITDRH